MKGYPFFSYTFRTDFRIQHVQTLFHWFLMLSRPQNVPKTYQKWIKNVTKAYKKRTNPSSVIFSQYFLNSCLLYTFRRNVYSVSIDSYWWSLFFSDVQINCILSFFFFFNRILPIIMTESLEINQKLPIFSWNKRFRLKIKHFQQKRLNKNSQFRILISESIFYLKMTSSEFKFQKIHLRKNSYFFVENGRNQKIIVSDFS